MNYNDYLNSSHWHNKTKAWRTIAFGRCAMFPFIRGYHCHHVSYKNFGNEKYKRDIVVLSPFAHKFIIHGVLSGFKRPNEQKKYPNIFQRIAHLWCQIPLKMTTALVIWVLLLNFGVEIKAFAIEKWSDISSFFRLVFALAWG